MGITVNGPYSGKPVKVRDQDVGRAVKDEEGRIFYVLPKKDGSGHFGSMTRAGSEKDEARAKEYEAKADKMTEGREEQYELSQTQGRARKQRSGLVKKVVLLIVVAGILAAGYWAVTSGPLKGKVSIPGVTPSSATP